MSKLSAILRIADSLDRTHANLVRAVRCTINPKTIELRLETDDDPELELWTARRKGDLFEELFGRRLRFAVDLPAEAMSPRGLAKEGDQVVHPTLAPKHARERRLAKTRAYDDALAGRGRLGSHSLRAGVARGAISADAQAGRRRQAQAHAEGGARSSRGVPAAARGDRVLSRRLRGAAPVRRRSRGAANGARHRTPARDRRGDQEARATRRAQCEPRQRSNQDASSWRAFARSARALAKKRKERIAKRATKLAAALEDHLRLRVRPRSTDPDPAREAQLRAWVEARVAQRRSEVERLFEITKRRKSRVIANPESDVLHGVRVAIKHWRYASEIARAVMPRVLYRPMAAKLRHLQDVGGNSQDYADLARVVEEEVGHIDKLKGARFLVAAARGVRVPDRAPVFRSAQAVAARGRHRRGELAGRPDAFGFRNLPPIFGSRALRPTFCFVNSTRGRRRSR